MLPQNFVVDEQDEWRASGHDRRPLEVNVHIVTGNQATQNIVSA